MLGCYQGFLLDNLRRRRPFSFKGQLEMADGPVNGLGLFDKRDDSHLATTCRTETTAFAGKHEEVPHLWFSACLLLEGRGEARRQRKGENFHLLLYQSLLSWKSPKWPNQLLLLGLWLLKLLSHSMARQAGIRTLRGTHSLWDMIYKLEDDIRSKEISHEKKIRDLLTKNQKAVFNTYYAYGMDLMAGAASA